METYKAFAGKQTNLNHIIQIAFNLALWYNFVEWIQCCILRVYIKAHVMQYQTYFVPRLITFLRTDVKAQL